VTEDLFVMETRLAGLDAHNRLILAVIAALVTFFLTLGHLDVAVQSITVWNAFAWTVIILAWVRIVFADFGVINQSRIESALARKTIRSMQAAEFPAYRTRSPWGLSQG
jgi:hypothetical protein